MGKRQVDLRGVVEEEEKGWRRKIRERKNRNFSQHGSRGRTRPRMGDGQVGDWGRGIRNGCIRVEEGGGGEGVKYCGMM